jgi:iron(III) transport system ATP-binding protein
MNYRLDTHREGVTVRLKGVTKRFGALEEVVALDRVSLEFRAGELTTLLGPSGCGKTTALRCMAGFYEPDEGDIFIGDDRVNGVPPYARPTGTVFQNYALFPHMTIFENIAYGLRVKRVSGSAIRDQVEKVVALLHLEGLPDRYPKQLSGGQQQRVAIARVLVNEPKVLLLDEPLSNLDAKLRIYTRTEIKALQRSLGITTIYVTHDQEEAMAVSDRMAVMNAGRVEQLGFSMEIYRKPRTAFVADFIGLTNLLPARVESQEGDRIRVEMYGQVVEAYAAVSYAPGTRVQLVSRPEMLSFASEEDAKLEGCIRDATFLGSLARYRVELPDGTLVTVDEENPSTLRAVGTAASLFLDAESLWILDQQACDETS